MEIQEDTRMESKGSIAVTEGIKIEVEPEFIPKELAPGEAPYYFSYRVTISNEGEKYAKLQSRHWIIIDAEGRREDVEGEAVVGYKPELHPGDTFTYTSYCPLDTPWGTMEGTYKMIRDDGSEFRAKIERFYLVSPEAVEEKG
ncbi:MAG: Co2+/Mg2+ efflux protein ApaG [Candidatus Kapaibacterium sp.]